MCEDYRPLGCDTMYSGRCLLIFWTPMLPLHKKCLYISTRPYSIISQKRVIFIVPLQEPQISHENFVSRIPEIMDSVQYSHVVISSVSWKHYLLIFCLFSATHIFVFESLSFICPLKFAVMGVPYHTYIRSNVENTEASKNYKLLIFNQL
jgi:hypothetical protein